MKITINEVLTKFRGSTIKLLSHLSNQLLKISMRAWIQRRKGETKKQMNKANSNHDNKW